MTKCIDMYVDIYALYCLTFYYNTLLVTLLLVIFFTVHCLLLSFLLFLSTFVVTVI